MKKLICIFMLCWLPISIAAAQLMSTNMMLDKQLPSTHSAESCHQQSNQQHDQKHKSHACSVCGLCIFASVSAVSNDIAFIEDLPKASQKYIAFEPNFASVHSAPAIKPPILN